MDTGSHFVLGISIAGLSNIDPAVANNPVLAEAVFLGAIIGSQAPDFDAVTKFIGGNTSYIKHHRGITHSLPALFIWPTFIALLLLLFFPVNYLTLWTWIFISITVHILLDILNSYGTQALKPISDKWFTLNIINIFDPFIFVIHSVAIILWGLQAYNPATIFVAVYLLTAVYILWRVYSHIKIKILLVKGYGKSGIVTVLPTINWFVYNVIENLPDRYEISILRKNKLSLLDSRNKFTEDSVIKASKQDNKIKAFLYFSSFAYPEYKKIDIGYQVVWTDLRYRFKNHYPFIGVAILTDDLMIIGSYVGWVYNEKHFKRKMASMQR